MQEQSDINAEKSEFINIGIHQLRTPITGIEWAVKLILKGELGPINEEQKNYLEQCYKNSTKALSLISNILMLDRISHDNLGYNFSKVDLIQVINKLISELKFQTKDKRISFVFDTQIHTTLMLSADEKKLYAALENLLVNAIKYTIQQGTISVNLTSEVSSIVIAITDTGVGIPEDEQKRIFERFYRAANVLSLPEEGSGIGLFITKKIIERHKGTIWFESKEGHGTTFYIRLPIQQDN